MRRLFVLLQNLLTAVFVGTQNLLKRLGLRAPVPEYVSFELRGDPPWRPPPLLRRAFARLSGPGPTPDLHTLSHRFERIARTGRVRGVVLRVDGFTGSLSKIDALCERVEMLRGAGKEVVFWCPQATQGELLLLFRGDRLFLAPGGRLDLKGFAVEAMTAGRAMQKLGVRPTVFRRGTHKTAAEIFTEDGISDAQRETLEAILDDLDARLIGSLVEGRGLDASEARRVVDEGPYPARRALEAGLVDGLCFGDEVAARLAEAESPTAVEGSEGRGAAGVRIAPWLAFRASGPERIDWKPVLGRHRVVAVIPIRGFINEGESRLLPGGVQVAGARSIGEALAAARSNPAVRAVVLHIDSRGGSALASDLIWREVRRTAAKKPVVAFLDRVAASGGYYCAAAATEIVASPGVLTGSIGVVTAFFDLSGLYGRLGLRREVLARGRRAALGTTTRPPTEDERQAMEEEVAAVYACFLDRVAEGRGLSRAAVEAVAEGRVYTGRRALDLGLVDAVGDFEDALEAARRLCGLPRRVTLEVRTLDLGAPGLLPRLLRPVGRAARWASALGPFDPFDLAWLERALGGPELAWAVLPAGVVGPGWGARW